MSKAVIKGVAEQLEIPYLVHFTRAANLATILRCGIYPVDRVHEIGVNPEINDDLRLDGHRDGTSLSIAHPNCQMFYKYQKEDESVEWVILLIDPSILWVKDCAFCKHNAADARISYLPLADLKTPQAFQSLYEELDSCLPRAEQCLKKYDPTDVQAEVLVFDVIGPEWIYGVVFESNQSRERYSTVIGDLRSWPGVKGKGLFATRSYIRKYC